MEQIGWALLGRDGHLRAGWRLLGHLVLMGIAIGIAVLGTVVVSLVMTLADLEMAGGWLSDASVSVTVSSALTWFILMVVLALSAWLLDARFRGGFRMGRLRGVGQGGPALRSLAELIFGGLMGALALMLTVGIMAVGGVEVQIPEYTLNGVARSGLMAVGLIFAAWLEELLFRGYLFQWLGGAIQRVLQWGANLAGLTGAAPQWLASFLAFSVPTLLLSVLFGVAHLSNPHATWFGTANTVLAGVWFCVLVLRQGSLWMAVSAHWSWNATMLLGLGLPVSGNGGDNGFDFMPLIDVQPTGPEWLSGGAYGPEASVACTVVLVLLIAVSAVLPRRKQKQGLVAAYAVVDPEVVTANSATAG